MNIEEYCKHHWLTELASEIETFSETLITAIRISKKRDKVIYLELEMDAGNFSRYVNGLANFPPEKLALFCEITCDLPLIWLAKQRGYELSAHGFALEAQVKDLEAQNKLLKEIIGAKQE